MAKMVAPMLEAMLKNPFRIIFTSRGDVEDVKFPPGNAGEHEQEHRRPDGKHFLADWIKQIGLISLFPEGPITPGQSWMHETTMKNPLLGNQAIKTTFRYAGTETRDARPLEKIDLTMSWKPEGKKQEGEKKDAEKKAETTRLTISEGKGVLLFDNSEGRVVESTMEMRMKIDMAVMGQKVTQDLNMKMHMSPLPAESVPAPSAKEKIKRQDAASTTTATTGELMSVAFRGAKGDTHCTRTRAADVGVPALAGILHASNPGSNSQPQFCRERTPWRSGSAERHGVRSLQDNRRIVTRTWMNWTMPESW